MRTSRLSDVRQPHCTLASGPRRSAVRTALALASVLFACLVSAGAAAASTQAPTFARADYPQIGGHFVAADFNGDGRLDLAGSAATAVAVLLNNGSGGFAARAQFPVAGNMQDLAAGDFNGDGNVDLAVTINNPQIGVSLLAGNGDGTFDPAVNLPNSAGADSPAIVATDLDGDARLDLVIAHSMACYTAPCVTTELMSVLMGNGDGTFQPARLVQVGRGMARIAVGDFNRDGIKDLAIAGDSSRLYRMYGVGDGTFVQQPTITLTADTFGVAGSDVDVADFNGDAIQDLVVVIGTNGSRTAVLIGNADGSFRPPLILTDANLSIPTQAAVADYNGDGFQDLAVGVGDGSFGLMKMYNGNGNGTFQAPIQMLIPPDKSSIGTVGLITAALNADTKPDLVLGIGGAFPGLAVLLNATSLPPPPTPSAPSLLSPAPDATPAQPIAFDWTDVSAATSYRIQIDDGSDFANPVLDRLVTPSQFTAPFFLNIRRHWWRVRGINAIGTAGPWSSIRRFTPQSSSPPPPAPAALSALSVSPASVTGGTAAQGTVTLTAAAPVGGFPVTLSSSNPATASVPASVSVAQGATSADFTVTTSAVTASTPVTITASAGSVTRTATLTVTPPGQNATLTVTATGRGGERVTSSPAGINVAVGSSGSAAFPVGTRVTLSATNQRDVIWSGACSSGGQKVKTCAFTLNGPASVTANVQ
jgi:FG-GAP-like repeat